MAECIKTSINLRVCKQVCRRTVSNGDNPMLESHKIVYINIDQIKFTKTK